MSQNAAADDDYAAEDCGSAAAASLSFSKLLLPEVSWDCVLGGKLLLSFFSQGNLPTYQQAVFYEKEKLLIILVFVHERKLYYVFLFATRLQKMKKIMLQSNAVLLCFDLIVLSLMEFSPMNFFFLFLGGGGGDGSR
jgi:hypothetical protein